METEARNTTPETPQEPAPLTNKKKKALLEYLGIMFAGAFLVVAISLGIKLIVLQEDLDAANAGARENISRLQSSLDAEKATTAQLQEELDRLTAEAETAAQEASAAVESAKQAEAAAQTAEEEAKQQVTELERHAEATQHLLLAQTAYLEGKDSEFQLHMQALESLEGALSIESVAIYQELQDKLP